jgi:hypothetical protein
LMADGSPDVIRERAAHMVRALARP